VKVVHNLTELRAERESLAEPFGLVATMGFLHDGHLSLVRRARAECASVGVSIFVNPAQFGPQEDLHSYPVDLERDQQLLRAEAVDLLWIPDREAVYGEGYRTWVDVEGLTAVLEGEHRPGHFRGVTTIVTKLFNSFQPDRAYFGQKDAQQSLVIRRMVRDLDFPVEVVVCPTIREADGLAMSSRNAYLSSAQREAASAVYQALQAATTAFRDGVSEANRLRDMMSEVVAAESLARIQYVSVADPETLGELDGRVERALLSMAVYFGQTRLIDNMLVGD
jgi:pantoate--beta-alanine ligase